MTPTPTPTPTPELARQNLVTSNHPRDLRRLYSYDPLVHLCALVGLRYPTHRVADVATHLAVPDWPLRVSANLAYSSRVELAAVVRRIAKHSWTPGADLRFASALVRRFGDPRHGEEIVAAIEKGAEPAYWVRMYQQYRWLTENWTVYGHPYTHIAIHMQPDALPLAGGLSSMAYHLFLAGHDAPQIIEDMLSV